MTKLKTLLSNSPAIAVYLSAALVGPIMLVAAVDVAADVWAGGLVSEVQANNLERQARARLASLKVLVEQSGREIDRFDLAAAREETILLAQEMWAARYMRSIPKRPREPHELDVRSSDLTVKSAALSDAAFLLEMWQRYEAEGDHERAEGARADVLSLVTRELGANAAETDNQEASLQMR